jgi:hypothetical protein
VGGTLCVRTREFRWCFFLFGKLCRAVALLASVLFRGVASDVALSVDLAQTDALCASDSSGM